MQRLVLERRLGKALPAAEVRLPNGVLDRGSQPADPVLEDVVRGALADGGHREVIADGPRDDDEGNIEPGLFHQLQGADRVELRLVVVGQDQVQLRVEIRLERRLVVGPAPGGIESGAAELVERQLGVLRPVLKDQHAQGSPGHGCQFKRSTEQLVVA